LAVCRNNSDALDGLDIEVLDGVDVTDPQLGGLVHRLEGRTLDVVINNAGILTRESLDDLDFERMRRQFEINALGPLRLTAALIPQLGVGAKVAVITSRMGSIGDNTSGARYGYRMSKAAVNIAFVSLARDLADRGIAVAVLHPGYVRTDMTEGRGLIDADEAAAGLLARIDELNLDNSGTFWHAKGEPLPW